jgi:hypothetical protein
LTTNRRKNLIGFTILIFVGAFIYFMAYKEDKALAANKKITIGRVYETATYYQNPNSVFVKYTYALNGKEYKGQTSLVSEHKYDDCQFLRTVLVGKTFPVIYDSLDYDNSKILLAKRDYERYGIKRVDTLNYFYHIVDSIQKN